MIDLTHALFAGLTGDRFEVSDADGNAGDTLVLTQVEEKGSAFGREAFSLLFRGAAALVLPQGIWLVRHAALGEQAIFLVPIGRDGEGTTYQAVFN